MDEFKRRLRNLDVLGAGFAASLARTKAQENSIRDSALAAAQIILKNQANNAGLFGGLVFVNALNSGPNQTILRWAGFLGDDLT